VNVSHIHRCAFFHVPRTGGSSIEALGWWDEWTGHFPAARELAERARYFSFAFVRNPWDRFVSLYHYFVDMAPQHRWYHANRKLIADIRRFRNFGEFCRGFDTWRHRADFHFWPQCHWITGEVGRPLVDFVGRFERLPRDWARVCEHLGLPGTRLPKINSSRHGPYERYYDDTTRRVVTALVSGDAAAFGYEFGDTP
jgi:hypothetical protein